MMNFKPREEVDRLFVKDGQKYWVSGYTVFDPGLEFSSRKGLTTAKLKKKSVPRMDEILIVAKGQYKPMRVKLTEVRHHQPSAVSFSDVFGSFGSTAVVLSGVEFAEQEDLSIGFDEYEGEDVED